MKRGSILLTVMVILLVVSAIGTGVFVAFQGYRNRAEYNWQLLEASYRASNALNLGIAFLKKYSSGLVGIQIPNWSTGSVGWFSDFEKRVYAQTDGSFWKNTLALIDRNRYYDLSSERGFSSELSKYGLGSGVAVVAFPFQSPYYLFLVSRSQVGRAVVYRYAILRANFLNKYAYFTEKETMIVDGREILIYFITNDIVDGPLRSNDVIRVSGSPLFKGSVEFADIRVEAGTGPIYLNPPPKRLTKEDIDKYNIATIKENYFFQLERLVLRVADAVKSTVPVGLRLPRIVQEEVWRGITRVLRRKVLDYVISFKDPMGTGSQSTADALRVFFIERETYESTDGGRTWTRTGSTSETKGKPLFSLRPKKDGTYHLVVHGKEAREILGLDRNEYDLNFNGVIFAEGDVYLRNARVNSNGESENKSGSEEGKPTLVDGRFTVVAGYRHVFDEKAKTFKENATPLGNVFIEDPIIYADYVEVLRRISGRSGDSLENIVKNVTFSNPEHVESLKNHESDDFLNIVAAVDIVVNEKRRNMKIFGSLYAFDGSFYVKGYNVGNPVGELLVFGSIMQYRRGPVGTFRWEGGRPRVVTGYFKNYVYDWRILKGLAVPGTPSLDEELEVQIVREVY